MDNILKSSYYFNLNSIDSLFVKLFNEKEPVWNGLSSIGSILNKLFEDGILKGDYSKNVFIHESARVDKSARIEGPCFIGANAEIKFNAYLRENVIIMDNSKVGHACEVKNSIVFPQSVIAHFNYVGDSIIGKNVNLSAGVVLANFRLDKKKVTIKTKDGRIDTGLLKFGAIIGDDSNIGVNSVLNPGTLLGKNSVVYPLVSVNGVYPTDSIIK